MTISTQSMATPLPGALEEGGAEDRFTPGPWKAEFSNAYCMDTAERGSWTVECLPHDVCDIGRVICEVDPYGDAETEANARLIAAAPDLYAALILCLERVEAETQRTGSAYTEGIACQSRAALAKARSGQ